MPRTGVGSFPSVRRLLAPASIIVLLLWALLRAPAASCGYVPQTALAQSLGLNPELLDYPSQVFRFPEMAPLYAPQVLAFSSTGDAFGLGAMFKVGSQRAMVLSQPRVNLDPAMNEIPLPSGATGSATMLQAGWAGGWAGLRLGLALRGFLQQSREDDSELDWSPSDASSENYEERRGRVLEGAFGVGVGNGRSRLDATVESRWETLDEGTADLSSSYGSDRAVLVGFHRSGKPVYALALQALVPLGSRGSLVGVGTWGGKHESWDGYLLAGAGMIQVDSLGRTASYEDRWSIGVACNTATESVDRLTAAAFYASSRVPDFVSGQDRAQGTLLTNRQGVLSLSLEKRIRGALAAQAGLAKFYTFTRTSLVDLWPAARVDFRTLQAEATTDQFSWGLTYSWKRIRLVGAVDTTLRLESPFLALDVSCEL